MLINKLIKCSLYKGKLVSLFVNIENVYFVYINDEMIENFLDKEEAEYFYDLCKSGYNFFTKFNKEE